MSDHKALYFAGVPSHHPLCLVDELPEVDMEVVEHLDCGIACNVALVAPVDDPSARGQWPYKRAASEPQNPNLVSDFVKKSSIP